LFLLCLFICWLVKHKRNTMQNTTEYESLLDPENENLVVNRKTNVSRKKTIIVIITTIMILTTIIGYFVINSFHHSSNNKPLVVETKTVSSPSLDKQPLTIKSQEKIAKPNNFNEQRIHPMKSNQFITQEDVDLKKEKIFQFLQKTQEEQQNNDKIKDHASNMKQNRQKKLV